MGYPPSEMISPAHIRDTLENPLDYPWRSHGIGMLRCYLDGAQDWRLNLWHPRLLNDGISTMHTHPWAFDSYILAGALTNTRFMRYAPPPSRVPYHDYAEAYYEGIIPCGAHAPKQHDAGPLIEGDPQKVWLVKQKPEVYRHGAQYRQSPEEIHDTRAEPGTITVMHRTHYDLSGRASVFWPFDTPWGDASRGTSEEDILVTCAAALEQLSKTPWRN